MLRPPPWLRFLLLAILVAATAWSLLNREVLGAPWLADFVDDHPGAMPAVFVVLHVATSLAFLPRGLMALAAGGLFGLAWGCVLATAGTMAGAMAGFLVARYVNANMLRAERVPRVGHVLKRAENGGWRLVFVTRLVPVLPQQHRAEVEFGLARAQLVAAFDQAGPHPLGTGDGLVMAAEHRQRDQPGDLRLRGAQLLAGPDVQIGFGHDCLRSRDGDEPRLGCHGVGPAKRSLRE